MSRPPQASQILYDGQGPGAARLVATGLFDRDRSCLALNSRDAQCAAGVRPFFLAAIPVSPTNTADAANEVRQYEVRHLMWLGLHHGLMHCLHACSPCILCFASSRNMNSSSASLHALPLPPLRRCS